MPDFFKSICHRTSINKRQCETCKTSALPFIFRRSPHLCKHLLCHHLKLNVVLPDKMFLKKSRRPKTKLTNTPSKTRHPVKKNTKKYPAQKHRASQIVKKLTTPAKRLLRQYQLSHQRCSRGKGRSKVWQSPGTQGQSPSSLPSLRISYSRCCLH